MGNRTTRRDFLKIGAAGAASAALGWPRPLFAAESDRKPNVMVILSDDHGYAELGCQGCKDMPTPHIDSIAANGVRFTSGYVSCPVCSPTRAGLMTGRYQQRFGHEHNPGTPRSHPDFGLARTEVTLAERLKAAGYATGLVGKWHLGFKRENLPLSRGFDEFFGFHSAAHSYTDAKAQPNNPIMRGNDEVDEPEYLTDAFGREAAAFVRKHAKKPFFLYLAFSALHAPLEAKDDYMKRFEHIGGKKRKVAAMLASMDDAVGSVLAEVRKNGLEEQTLIFFLSDNGSPHSYGTNGNAPLRGFKTDVWEGGIRIPYLVQWKGKLPAGKVYDEPVISLDIHATALSAAGVKFPEDKKLDGVDLLPFLASDNQGKPHDSLFWRFGKRRAVRQGDFKLVWQDSDTPALYNLAADIGESEDLSPQNPEKVRQLQSLYDKWSAQMAEPKWLRGGGKLEFPEDE